MEIYLNSSIRLHGMVLRKNHRHKFTLPFTFTFYIYQIACFWQTYDNTDEC